MELSAKHGIPNRWLTIMVALGATGCGPQDKIVTIKGVTYSFPASDADGFISSEENSRDAHSVQLKPISGHFLLIYDPSTTPSKNEQGPGVPTFSYINFAPGSKVDVIGTGRGAIVCLQTTSGLAYTCGMRVSDSGLDWVIMFDRDLLASHAQLKANAEKILLGYRTRRRLRK